MQEFEFDDIISHWTSEYGVELEYKERNQLIRLFETATALPQFKSLSFDNFIKNVIRQKYYDDKYPGLNLFSAAYSIVSQN